MKKTMPTECIRNLIKCERDLFAFLPLGENEGFAPSSRREQQSTGLLHLIIQIPLLRSKKSPYPDGYGDFLKTNPNFNTNAPPFELRGCKVNLGGAFLSRGGANLV